jgi:aldose 1-epimerase
MGMKPVGAGATTLRGMQEQIGPSGEQIELTADEQRVVVVGVGGGLRRYDLGDESVLDGYSVVSMCCSGRGQLLAPWPNRVQDGSYEFDGRRFQLAIDEPERQNAIHGLVRWSTWSVVAQEPDRAVLAHRLHPTPGYPFTLDLRVEYSLAAEGLTVRADATNVGEEACPYGFGAHPYLSGGDGLVDDLELRVPSETALVSDERSIPVARESVDGTELDFRVSKPLGSIQLDHCFTDLVRDGDARARVELGGRATLWVDESYPYVMVFTGDALPDVARRSVAVEPMTCAPNAFRSGDGLIRLEPGEMHSGTWGIAPAHS